MWNGNPAERPSFGQICDTLEAVQLPDTCARAFGEYKRYLDEAESVVVDTSSEGSRAVLEKLADHQALTGQRAAGFSNDTNWLDFLFATLSALPDEPDHEFWQLHLMKCLQRPSGASGRENACLDRPQLDRRSFVALPFAAPLINVFSDCYILGPAIGGGTYAKVYELYDIETGQEFACKRIPVSTFGDDVFRVCREIVTLVSVAHPAILPFVGWNFHLLPRGERGSTKEGEFVLVTQFLKNKSLRSCLRQRRNPSERTLNATERTIVMYGVARGMKLLHRFDMIHRDLKPENILLDEYNRPMIGDFGEVKMIER
jgi:hypothetical protein